MGQPPTHDLPASLWAQALAAVSDAVLVSDARAEDHPIVFATPVFEQLTGYALEEVLGRNCRFLQGPGTDPVAVGRLRAALQAGEQARVTLLNFRKDGSRFWNEVSLLPVIDADGTMTHVIGVQHDVSELVESQALWSAHRGVHDVLSTWEGLDEGVSTLLARLGAALGWVAGGLWAPQGPKGRLECRAFWTQPGEPLEELEQASRALTLRSGEGLIGQAWQQRAVVVTHDVSALPGFARTEAAEAAGVRGAMAVPALHADEPVAVLELYSYDDHEPDANARMALALIGEQLGALLHRRRADLQPGVLTAREVEVLQLAAQGLGVADLANALVISPATVRTHFKNIYDRLGVRDRAAAVAEAMRLGAIS